MSSSSPVSRSLKPYNNDLGQPGLYVTPPVPGIAPNTLLLTANRAFGIRFVPSRAMAVTKILFTVSTAATNNDNVDVGIHNATTLARVASSGATAAKLNGSTNVWTSVSLSATAALAPGVPYYVTLSCGAVGGTAATLRSIQTISGVSAYVTAFGSTSPNVEMFFTDTAHPLPNPLTVQSAVANAPILVLSEQ